MTPVTITTNPPNADRDPVISSATDMRKQANAVTRAVPARGAPRSSTTVARGPASCESAANWTAHCAMATGIAISIQVAKWFRFTKGPKTAACVSGAQTPYMRLLPAPAWMMAMSASVVPTAVTVAGTKRRDIALRSDVTPAKSALSEPKNPRNSHVAAGFNDSGCDTGPEIVPIM